MKKSISVILGAVLLAGILFIRQYKMEKCINFQFYAIDYNIERVSKGEKPANRIEIKYDTISFYVNDEFVGKSVIYND